MQTSVYGPDYDEPGFGAKKPTAGKKRPAPEEEAAMQEALAGTDYEVAIKLVHCFHVVSTSHGAGNLRHNCLKASALHCIFSLKCTNTHVDV